MASRCSDRRAQLTRAAVLGAWGVCLATALARGQDVPSSNERLVMVREQIRRLKEELVGLASQEQGLLGALERLGTDLRLRRAQVEEVNLRLDQINEQIATAESSLSLLEEEQGDRLHYLAFRLREIYKAGQDDTLRRLLGGERVGDYWDGLRYAAYLSERDARVLGDFRQDRRRLADERALLVSRREQLDELRQELRATERQVQTSRDRRSATLQAIRADSRKRQTAIEELKLAAEALGGLADSVQGSKAPSELDVRKFRGLLDWPSRGEVVSKFGTVVHPRFKTQIPHPGLDIDAEFGEPIRSVFDGRVVYSGWLRGYGLTTLVDHGHEVLSVYAHASLLMVEAGETVLRGQTLGHVGDTGSLRGPYLYLELRVDATPVDPIPWLRPR